jgi:hypothetical protein
MENLRVENILWPFGIFLRPFGIFLWPFGNVVVFWHIFPRFGILCLEKSGNPGFKRRRMEIAQRHLDAIRLQVILEGKDCAIKWVRTADLSNFCQTARKEQKSVVAAFAKWSSPLPQEQKIKGLNPR